MKLPVKGCKAMFDDDDDDDHDDDECLLRHSS